MLGNMGVHIIFITVKGQNMMSLKLKVKHETEVYVFF